ncbi:MAG: [protein-PII] uridylyltransferase [Candidatus Latescibacteria bacterium]|nr:[protein-PII] uridylyltransferase [Candidatus Latescibacterota bacterium]
MPDDRFYSNIKDFSRIAERAFSDIARDHPYANGSTVDIRRSLNAYRAGLKCLYQSVEEHHLNKAPGKLICSMLTELIDCLVIHAHCLFFSGNTDSDELVIIALGGYGRSELNPYSDIDILFLSRETPDNRQNNSIQAQVQFLWDMNLDLGHSTRTIEDCLDAAKNDTYLATSLLEPRFITGNRTLWDDFINMYSNLINEGFGKEIAAQKIKDIKNRHEYFHNTVQIQEPNIKECPGTLRDIHTIRWLLLSTHQGKYLRDLTKNGLLTESEETTIEDDMDFLLRLRNALHFAVGKKSDVLNHLSLPDIAKNLRYTGTGAQPVEKLMREYYMHVARIRQLTCRIVDEFTTLITNATPEPFKAVSEHFSSNGKYIRLKSETSGSIKEHPGLLVEIFSATGAQGLNITRKTSSVISERIQSYGLKFPQYEGVETAFHNLINMRSGVAYSLRLLHEHDMLVKLIPEFASICWHYQYDFYHRFTTDEHSLRVVKNLEDMAVGNSPADPELIAIMQDVAAKGALYLAGLLHDIGKSSGASHSKHGERLAALALKRLGFDDRTIELVRFLIREHLLMSHISQRRDIEDKDTINDFIKIVTSTDRLRMLTLLTFADLMALSEDALTDWKRALIWDLYDKVFLRIEKGFDSTAHTSKEHFDRVYNKLKIDVPKRDIGSHLSKLPEQYLRVTTPAMILKHIKGIELMKKRGAWASFRHHGKMNTLTVIAPDHPKALSNICGAITSSDINIIRAQIFTRDDDIIIDTFHVVNESGEALIEPETQFEFKQKLPKIISGEFNVRDLIRDHTRRWKRRKKQVVYSPPRLKIYNDISPNYTIMDVFATDYTGLLYDITSVIASHDIDIHTAKIGTDEDQVADAFYIRKDGKKITDKNQIEQLSNEIIKCLSSAFV